MDPVKVPVEIRCAKCGEKSLVASGDTLTDDSVVTCKSCGARAGTWGDVRKHVLQASTEQIKKHLTDTFGDAFKPR